MNRAPSKTTCFIKTLILVFSSLLLTALVVSQAAARNSGPQVTCRVETDRAILPAGGPQRAIIKVTLDAAPAPQSIDRPPVNLAIVLDRSGSMTGRKIEKAKEAAIEALRHLGHQDIFSLIVYDNNAETIVPAGDIRFREEIESKIRRIRPGGSTALFSGVSQAAAEIRKNLEERYVHRIILLSDGIANIGPSTPEDLGRLGAALIKEHISVTTVGVGTDYNEDLMTRLSQKSDGNTYFVEAESDLPRIFAAELGNVLNVVAKKIRLIIECGENVTPLSIIGREGRIKGNRVELSMNQLYGDQEKYALVEVEIPPSKSGRKMVLATAQAAYENPFTKKNETATGKTRAKFSDNLKKVEKSANVRVVRDYQLNLNALAEEKAISLSDKGKKEEAVQELKESAAKLKSIGSMYKDKKLLKEAKKIEAQADRIEKEGMTKKSRKALRTKSYQQKNQQVGY